ncbi:MAG: (d)CMP kinase [Pseudomonadota bacterium]
MSASDSVIAPVVSLDGPSGSGKGTVAATVAAALNWHYLDSGALYRILAWRARQSGATLDDVEELKTIGSRLSIRFIDGKISVDGETVGDEIRTESAGRDASVVAALPEVRDVLLEWQRRQARPPGLVADGRDMGTVVFPESKCKIYLTASAKARAERRFNQLRLKGFDVTMRALFGEITERDQRDANRAISPLKPADDAVVIDTTDMRIEAVVETVLDYVRQSYPESSKTDRTPD